MRTLFYNGTIYSMDDANNKYTCLLAEDGKIVELFRNEPGLTDARKVDLDGSVVFPGFIDTHTHSFEGGLYLLGVDLKNVGSLGQVFQVVKDAGPIAGCVIGYQFDENSVKERRFPTLSELDRCLPETPVIIRRVDGHSSVINSAAAKKIKWHRALPAQFDGLINADFDHDALRWFHQNVEKDKEAVALAYHKASGLAVSNGHTTIHTMVGDGENDPSHFSLMEDINRECDVEFIPYAQIINIEKALKLKARITGGCILADGSIGSRTAALSSPYAGEKSYCGTPYSTDQYWYEKISKAHSLEMPIAIHAIGDAATRQIAGIFHKVQKENPQNIRHQMIHAVITDDSTLEMLAFAGVCCTVQPAFDYLWGGENGLYEKKLGKKRHKMSNRFKTMMDKGLLIAAGSDWYVTAPDPLLGIFALVNHHNPGQRITMLSALSMYTSNAAKISGDETRIGQLKSGMDADMTCLDQDPLLLGRKSFSHFNVKVKKVIKKGKIIK